MRTRKHSCPVETVWVDKHKYDEAERLHYEREAIIVAIASEELKEMEVLNGISQDDSSETGPDGEHKKSRNGKKQRKRKLPKSKSAMPKLNFVLAGLLADHVWFDKDLYEKAECEYQTKLAADLAKALLENKLLVESSILMPNPEELIPSLNKRMAIQAISCSHGSLVACHHIIHGVWVNKVYFGDAEKSFIERYQSQFATNPLGLPLVLHDGDHAGRMQRTPDDGYVTAVSTPETSVASTLLPEIARTTRFPISTDPTVNGKPQWAYRKELIAEVWLDKPVYDDAEKYFFENMFAHSVTKVATNECQRLQQEVIKEDKKYQLIDVKEAGVKSEGFAAGPGEIAYTSPVHCFLHKDSEYPWLTKPESQYLAPTARVMFITRQVGTNLEMKPSHPAVMGHHLKKMAAEFLVHEKVWFDKFKYDDAERQYYEQLNGPVATSQCQQQDDGASTILRDIARARETIQKSLAGSPAPPAGADHSDLIARVTNLELENRGLHKVVGDLQLAVSKLETRLKTLEISSTSHSPAVVSTFQPQAVAAALVKEIEVAGATAAVEDDDDIDLFGSDEEEDNEAIRIREERLRQYAEKKSKTPGLIAKSSILLDVKPWDDETDMTKLEEYVRTVQMDGLVWGSSKLVPVGYGIRKLQIQCVVEDDKVGTDMLEEEITKFNEYVQSVDIAAFNKI